jgi:hypothetical protein
VFKLLEDIGHIPLDGDRISVEFTRGGGDDFANGRVAIATTPHVTGGRVQLVQLAVWSIKNNDLPVDVLDRDMRALAWKHGCLGLCNERNTIDMKYMLQAIVDDRSDFDIRGYSDTVVRQAIDVGLGPSLYRITRQGDRGVWHDALRAQDLAARVESLDRLDGLEEILSALPRELAAEILWLKGISLSQHVYPEAHLRMMGDIDLLVPSALQSELENALHGLGYVQRSPEPPEFYTRHHHSMPFVHTGKQIIVEVHTGLFPPATRFASTELFKPESLLRRCVADEFRGFPIKRLDDETELAYLATHWINERRCFGTAVIPMLDLAQLIRRLPAGFDWDGLFRALNNSPAAPYVRVALGFLHDCVGIQLSAVNRQGLADLAARPQAVVDPCLHRMIARHALAATPFGRFWTRNMANVVWDTLLQPSAGWINLVSLPWRLLFPPRQPRRYDPRFQLRRLMSTWRRGGHNQSGSD